MVHHRDDKVGLLCRLLDSTRRHEYGTGLVFKATHPGRIIKVEAYMVVAH